MENINIEKLQEYTKKDLDRLAAETGVRIIFTYQGPGGEMGERCEQQECKQLWEQWVWWWRVWVKIMTTEELSSLVYLTTTSNIKTETIKIIISRLKDEEAIRIAKKNYIRKISFDT